MGNAVQNTPPHVGNVVHEEEIRKTPPIDRLGHSKDERTETQKKFHVIDRVGTNAQDMQGQARAGTQMNGPRSKENSTRVTEWETTRKPT